MSAVPTLTAPDVAAVLAEIMAGEALSLAEAARLFPASRGKGRLNPATIWRWVTSGIETPDGSTLRLESVRLGGRYLTSRGALLRFAAAQSARHDAASPGQDQPTTLPPSRSSAAETAGAELARRGV